MRTVLEEKKVKQFAKANFTINPGEKKKKSSRFYTKMFFAHTATANFTTVNNVKTKATKHNFQL